MINSTRSPGDQAVSFINRDHIVSVVIGGTRIVVTTSLGTTVELTASQSALTKFADDLANSAQSNFVSIAASAEAAAPAT